jgi:hypothetical protein
LSDEGDSHSKSKIWILEDIYSSQAGRLTGSSLKGTAVIISGGIKSEVEETVQGHTGWRDLSLMLYIAARVMI